jgi:hypothetical protein
MHEPIFSAWESFFVIVGSSGAALTGLQFVVITLITEMRGVRSALPIAAFATPSIVHFCAVLLVSASLSAPWRSVHGPSQLLLVCGLVGVVYIVIVTLRARRQKDYKLVLEDWIWHTALPFVAYAALLAAGLLISRDDTAAMFTVAAVMLLLLFIGIHNAWDTVTFMVTQGPHPGPKAKDDGKSK